MTDRHEGQSENQRIPPVREGNGPVRTGWVVFLWLAVLTAVEFIVAVTVDANLPIMVVIALIKAGLIVYYFMHVLRIWRGEEEA